MSKMGLLDRPIATIEEDTLKLGEHAEALARFIRNCDTAMTIAIQGDWGSGKTSMMRMIEHKLLEGPGNERIRKTIRINTWELAQFGQSENIPILLLSAMVEGLTRGPNSGKSDTAGRLRGMFGMLGRVAVVTVGAAIGQGDAAKALVDQVKTEGDAPPADMVNVVRVMKEELEKLVKEVAGGAEGARVVVFIDDLDRLVPVRAVELLEVMKVFLDVPGCVFVLACDYQVVMKGLSQKFGVSEAQLSGKSFFDKIIQVPYCMPLHRYDVEKYMRSILHVVDKDDVSDADIRLYRGLTEKSVGFNPRGLKRIMNALVLMEDVTRGDRSGLREGQCTQQEWIRILFAILCLQQSYPALFRLMCEQQDLSQEWLQDLHEESLKSDPELQRLLKKDGAPDPDWQTMAEFCELFYEAIQLGSDSSAKNLSDSEIEVLKKLLDSSNIVASAPVTRKNRVRGFSDFRDDLLGSCENDAGAKAFFAEALPYLESVGAKFRPGEKGVSVLDGKGISRLQLYPLGTRKGPIFFVVRDGDQEMWRRAAACLPNGFPAASSKGTSFSAKPADLGSWEKARPAFDILFGVGGSAGS